jgi:hypothetical protein
MGVKEGLRVLRFTVLTAVNTKTTICMEVMSDSLVQLYRHFPADDRGSKFLSHGGILTPECDVTSQTTEITRLRNSKTGALDCNGLLITTGGIVWQICAVNYA